MKLREFLEQLKAEPAAMTDLAAALEQQRTAAPERPGMSTEERAEAARRLRELSARWEKEAGAKRQTLAEKRAEYNETTTRLGGEVQKLTDEVSILDHTYTIERDRLTDALWRERPVEADAIIAEVTAQAHNTLRSVSSHFIPPNPQELATALATGGRRAVGEIVSGNADPMRGLTGTTVSNKASAERRSAALFRLAEGLKDAVAKGATIPDLRAMIASAKLPVLEVFDPKAA